jgi:hypothetical protein
MTVALLVLLKYFDWRALPVERAAWDAAAADPRLLLATLMIAIELALLTAVALFFSAFSSSALLSLAFTIGIYVTGVFSLDLRRFGDIVEAPSLVSHVVAAVGWVVPAFSAFDIKAQVVHGLPVPAAYLALTAAYGVAYAAAVVAAAVLAFSRREFT